jgi:hypothetical protein
MSVHRIALLCAKQRVFRLRSASINLARRSSCPVVTWDRLGCRTNSSGAVCPAPASACPVDDLAEAATRSRRTTDPGRG